MLTYGISSDIYTPSMPSISNYFGESSDAVQRTLTFFFLGAAISCFVSGYLADLWGKTKICLYGFLVALVGSVIALTAQSLDALIIGRFFMGCGAAVGPYVGMAILQEELSEEKAVKVFGIMGIVFAVVPGLAPILGGLLDSLLGWRSNFWVILLMICISVFLIHFVLEREKSVKNDEGLSNDHIFRAYGKVLSNRTFFAYSLATPLIHAGEWATFSFLPFYAEEHLNLSSDEYGLFLGGMVIWFGMGSFLGGRFSKLIGIDNSILFSLFLSIFAGGMMLMTSLFIPSSLVMIYMSCSLYFMAFGILFPTSIPRALSAFKVLKSSASALRGLMTTFVGFIATYVAEVMDDTKLYQLACFILFVSLMALVSFVLLKPKVD